MDAKKKAGTPFQCRFCDQWKSKVAFGPNPERQWMYRRCVDCVEKRKCKGECQRELTQDCFTAREWKEAFYRSNRRGKCKKCMAQSERGTWRCTQCDFVGAKDTHFSMMMAGRTTKRNDGKAKCNECMEKTNASKNGSWRCVKCGHVGDKSVEFSIWIAARKSSKNNGKVKCNGCMDEEKPARGHWKCKRCNEIFPRGNFGKWLAPRKNKVNDGKARCDNCMDAEEAAKKALHAENMEHVQKKRRVVGNECADECATEQKSTQ